MNAFIGPYLRIRRVIQMVALLPFRNQDNTLHAYDIGFRERLVFTNERIGYNYN